MLVAQLCASAHVWLVIGERLDEDERSWWRRGRRRAVLGAVAFVCGVVASLAGQPSGALAASWARGIEVSLPANAGLPRDVFLSSVSCGSAGECSAVGEYTDSSGHWHGLLLTETEGVWAPGVEATLPANAGSNPDVAIASVSCATAGNCSAVGDYVDSSGGDQGLLLSEVGGVWAAGIDADVGSTSPAFLTSVSCAAAGSCSAVGVYTEGPQGLLVNETGGKWMAGIRAPLPSDASSDPGVFLGSVSCASAGNCTAVGRYQDSLGLGQGLLINETGGTWSTGVKATAPANAESQQPAVDVGPVSCPSAGDCSAVGDYGDSSGYEQALLLSESGGAWAAGIEATPPANDLPYPGPGVVLASLSCASAGDCSAVGSYPDRSVNGQGLLLGQTAGVWTAGVQATLPANAGSVALGVDIGSVSCPSVGDCSAVGDYTDSSARRQGLLLTETGGTWSPGVETTLPANAGPNPNVAVRSVSCVSAADCSAVGSFIDSSNNTQGLLLTAPAPPAPPPPPAPSPLALSRLRVSPEKFALAGRRVNGRCVKQTAKNRTHRRCNRPINLTVHYELNIPGRVAFTIKRLAPGRRVNGRCARPTNENKRHKRCTRPVRVPGKITLNGVAGAHTFTFRGRIGGRELRPGTYQLIASPSSGTPRTVKFQTVA